MIKFHLPQMGSIYANASHTITAVDGTDAEYGLRGLKDVPEAARRDLTQSTVAFGEKTFVYRRDNLANRFTSDPIRSYMKRGWTFQEHFFLVAASVPKTIASGSNVARR